MPTQQKSAQSGRVVCEPEVQSMGFRQHDGSSVDGGTPKGRRKTRIPDNPLINFPESVWAQGARP